MEAEAAVKPDLVIDGVGYRFKPVQIVDTVNNRIVTLDGPADQPGARFVERIDGARHSPRALLLHIAARHAAAGLALEQSGPRRLQVLSYHALEAMPRIRGRRPPVVPRLPVETYGALLDRLPSLVTTARQRRAGELA